MEFQYNNKRHVVTGKIPFELNFGRHPWKSNFMVQTEFSRLGEFLIRLQKSWKQATKSIEKAQKNIKRQFDRKRRNP